MYIQVSKEEHATILAALRFYQERDQGDPMFRSDAIHHIATAGGDDNITSLDDEGIDELCERINTANGKAEIIVLVHEARHGIDIQTFQNEAERLAWMDSYARANFGFEVDPDHDDYEDLLVDEFSDCDEPVKWEYITVAVPPAPAAPEPLPAKVWVGVTDFPHSTCINAFATEEALYAHLCKVCREIEPEEPFNVEGLAIGSLEMRTAIHDALEEREAWFAIEHVDVEGSPAATPEIAIIMEGGLIQEVMTRNTSPVIVRAVDYDTEGADEDTLTEIPLDDDKVAEAYVSGWTPGDPEGSPEFWAAIAKGEGE